MDFPITITPDTTLGKLHEILRDIGMAQLGESPLDAFKRISEEHPEFVRYDHHCRLPLVLLDSDDPCGACGVAAKHHTTYNPTRKATNK